MTTATDIDGEFRQGMKQVSESYGLVCQPVRQDNTLGQSRRALDIFRKTDHGRHGAWMLYYVIAGQEEDGTWELNPSIIFDLYDCTELSSYDWGIVLLDDSPDSGYFLSGRHVNLVRQKWPKTDDGNYKLTEKDLKTSDPTPFKSLEDLGKALDLTPGM